MIQPLRDWKGKEPVSAAHLQEPVDALRRLQRAVLNSNGASPVYECFLGVVVDAGPDEEADYSDERYWVQKASIPTSLSTDQITPEGYTAADLDLGGHDPTPDEPTIVTVTNLPELLDHTHNLTAGTPVHAFAFYDTTAANPRKHWVMSSGGAGAATPAVLIRITGPVAIGKYEGFVQRRKSVPFANDTTDLAIATYWEDDTDIAAALVINPLDAIVGDNLIRADEYYWGQRDELNADDDVPVYVLLNEFTLGCSAS